jgi:hypothetical protein
MSDQKQLFEITPEGSLGVLAYGDIAFRKWREIKKDSKQNMAYEEEE